MWIADALVLLLEVYAVIGVVFAIAFVTRGITKMDSQAEGATVGFRLIVLPGAAALWPLLLQRWRRGVTDPPIERNAHRDAAKGDEA